MEIFLPVSLQLERYRIELEQQIVAKRPGQRQPAVFGGAKLLDKRTQDRKRRGLLATLLFGEQRRQRLEPPMQAPVAEFELFPVRMVLEQRLQNLVQRFASLAERTKIHIAARGDNFNWRADGGHVPARISLWILIAGREIDSAIAIQFAQQGFEPFFVRNRRCRTGNSDPAGRGVTQFRHKNITQEACFLRGQSVSFRIAPPVGAGYGPRRLAILSVATDQ